MYWRAGKGAYITTNSIKCHGGLLTQRKRKGGEPSQNTCGSSGSSKKKTLEVVQLEICVLCSPQEASYKSRTVFFSGQKGAIFFSLSRVRSLFRIRYIFGYLYSLLGRRFGGLLLSLAAAVLLNCPLCSLSGEKSRRFPLVLCEYMCGATVEEGASMVCKEMRDVICKLKTIDPVNGGI